MATTRDAIIERIASDEDAWTALVAEVPAGRLTEPGPMGDWTFHDLVSHLLRWRLRTIARLEAARAGEPRPPNPWPPELGEDDPINAWFRDLDAGRSSDELLAEYAASFGRLARAVEALPPEAFLAESSAEGYARWRDANGELESDFSGHLADHADDVRAWLART